MTTEGDAMWSVEEMAARVASDISDSWTVNLGIGLPTSVAPELEWRPVIVHSENGILGMGGPPPEGEEDPEVQHAGKGPATIVPGGAIVDSVVSFSLIHGGRLDLALMGAYQVSVHGDLANWRLPEKRIAGIGGAADLAVGARRVWIIMKLYTKAGEPRLQPHCDYPITAFGCVSRVYTDTGVFARADSGRMSVVELAPGADLDRVCTDTGCDVGAPLLRT